MNAAEILLFRQGMLSPELSKMVAAAALQRDIVMRDVWQLTPHNTEEPDAEENVNFIAVPEPFEDFLRSWKALAADA